MGRPGRASRGGRRRHVDPYPTDSVDPIDRDLAGPTARSEFVVPTRMGFRWRYFNHRISNWSFDPTPEGRLDVEARGGPYSAGLGEQEYPLLDYAYLRVDGDDEGGPVATAKSLEVVLGPSGLYRGTQSWDIEELGLAGYDRIVALLYGYGFDTGIPQTSHYPAGYRASNGYLSRGLGAGVEVVSRGADRLEVGYWLRYGIGASLDRPAHNEATMEARIGGRVDLLLVGFDGASAERGGVEYELEYGEPRIGVEQGIAGPTEEQRRLRPSPSLGAAAGLYGLQAFNFDLTPRRSCRWTREWPLGDELRADEGGPELYGPPGYYVREMTVSVDRVGEPGNESDFEIEGYASNATHSIPFHPFRSHFAGRMVWLPVDTEVVREERKGPFATGAASFSLEE